MAQKKNLKAQSESRSDLKKGDLVIVISGGNKKKRPNKGKVGKILRFVGSERVVVEGVNLITKHQKAQGPNQQAGKIQKEGSIHVSNVMFYVEKLKIAVRLKHKILDDGKKVRGFMNPESKKFEEIAVEK